jgi:hypothetical protein
MNRRELHSRESVPRCRSDIDRIVCELAAAESWEHLAEAANRHPDPAAARDAVT